MAGQDWAGPGSLGAMAEVRPFASADWPGVWAVLEPVFRAGETFPHDPAIQQEEVRRLWVADSQQVMVAVDGAGVVVGTDYLRPNSLSLGAHVASAGYLVAQASRRKGSAAGSANTPWRRPSDSAIGPCSSTWW
jgi:hypothetical protein